MKAYLTLLHSPDAEDLRSFVPKDPHCFRLFVEASINSDASPGGDNFDFYIVTPEWLRREIETSGAMLGAHHIIINRWSLEEVERAIVRFLEGVEAPTWHELASTKLSRLGHWEFEDYQEYVEQ